MPDASRIGLSPTHFSNAFPFHFAFDADCKLLAFGKSLEPILQGVALGDSLDSCFEFKRPELVPDEFDFAEHGHTLFLIACRQSKIILRGQIISDADNRFVFLGSPWFNDSEELMAAGLNIGDFAIHDPVVDLLQLVQAQKMAFQDVQTFTERLKKQTDALTHANNSLEQQYQTLQNTERELRKQEAEARKLAHVAARTDNAVIITDADGFTEWVNDGFTQQTGYSLNEIKGKKPGSLLQGEETDPETVALMHDRLAQGKPFQVEIINYTKAGEPRWIEIEVQPIRDSSDQITNFVAIEADITQRKHTQEQLRTAKQNAEEASRMKSEFLATVSHEIRTPMNGVLGLSELLLDSNLDQRQRGLIQSIRSSATALVSVINDVLDLSKIESGKLEMHEEPFELRPLLDAVLETVANRCASNGVDLNAIIAPQIGDQYCADHGKLRQVLINLIGNAAKFTEQGEIRLEVIETASTPSSSTLTFRVTDTGIGFRQDEAESLFESFRQSDSSPARRHGGTGLGLSISERLVTMMKGTISAEGKPGVGATFTVTIPLQKVSAEMDTNAPRRPFPKLDPFQILGVSPTCQEALTNHLSHWGIESRIVSSADECDPSRHIVIRSMGTDLKIPPDDKHRVITMVHLDAHAEPPPDGPVLLWPVRLQELKRAIDCVIHPDQVRATEHAPDWPVMHGSATAAEPRYQNILVAEDNPINQQLISEILQQLGIKATLVRNGNEVLDSLSRNDYDCVLMDCQMPEMDGYETTRRVRELEADGTLHNHRTIIAMTANALFGDREKCLEAGMDDYMPKPLNLKAVSNKLMKASPEPEPEPESQSGEDEPQASSESIQAVESALTELANDLGVEAVEMLTEEFLADSPQRLERITALEANGEIADLRLESHSFKSVCQTYGLAKTAEQAFAIEQATSSDPPTATSAHIPLLLQHFKDESQAVQMIVKRLSNSGN